MRRPVAPSLVTLGVVGAVIAVVLWQLHLSLLLANTTTTGGDTGAHIGLAGFLRNDLLPHGHVTGWDPGAYDGYPLYTFYFPLPDVLVAVVSYVIPFNVAFKLVTVLGSVTLPIAAWAFGRLSGLERPRPAVLAAATLPYLFDQTFTIYGGNLYSTLAGEYAYSLGLSVALVFLGVVVRGMRTGRLRVPAAVLIGVCMLCHLVTALFALAGAVIILVLSGPNRRRVWWVVSAVGTGLLLVSWWLVPFLRDQAYSTDMGWLNVTTYWTLLVPKADLVAIVLAGLGVVLAVVVAIRQRQSAPLLLAVLGAVAALAVRFDPQGKLYNVRFLPLWILCVYLLAGYAVAETCVGVAHVTRRIRLVLWRDAVAHAPAGASVDDDAGTHAPSTPWARPRFGPWAPGAVVVPLVALLAALVGVLPPLVPWLDNTVHTLVHHDFGTDSVPGWAQWNYSGYERSPAWPELHDGVIDTMERVARHHGCGRAMWEYNADLNRFGTPESLMMLPYWTDNCIDSIEGVLFESSATTPYHFLNQSELSAEPSQAMVSSTTGIDYGPLDVELGVEHLQLLGIKYFLASSPSVQAQASADPALTLVATSGPWRSLYQGTYLTTTWKVYEVADASIVSPLTRTPDVLVKIGPGQGSWFPIAQRWYENPADWSQQLVADGPVSWVRTADAAHPPPGVREPVTHVSGVRVGIDTVSFHVDRTGVPVVVRVSYFPNWHAAGALGPWRAEPNLMVVVPTAHTVTLSYGSDGADRLGLVLSVLGVVAFVALVGRRRFVPARWSSLVPRAAHRRR